MIESEHLDDERLHVFAVVSIPPLEDPYELCELAPLLVSCRDPGDEVLRVGTDPLVAGLLGNKESLLRVHERRGDVDGEGVGIVGVTEEALHGVVPQFAASHLLA